MPIQWLLLPAIVEARANNWQHLSNEILLREFNESYTPVSELLTISPPPAYSAS
jgi:hypothetical protein